MIRITFALFIAALAYVVVAARGPLKSGWIATRDMPTNYVLQNSDLRPLNQRVIADKNLTGKFLIQPVKSGDAVTWLMVSDKPAIVASKGSAVIVLPLDKALRGKLRPGDSVELVSQKDLTACTVPVTVVATSPDQTDGAWVAMQFPVESTKNLRKVVAGEWILLLGADAGCGKD